jgi:hypothetical protein
MVDEAESRRRFLDRLSDWSEPGAITIIRDGIPLDLTAIPVEGDEIIPPAPTVADIDDEGNIRLSDGSIIVPPE